MFIEIHPYYFSKTKRLFDIVLSLILIIFISPVYFLIFLYQILSIGLPIIYKQKRAGLNSKPFIMYKFRTMTNNAHNNRSKYLKLNQAPYPMFKIFNDPRFVGAGQFLSRSGLDELPQLFNILKGEMSFVGPRPLPVNEARELSSAWNFRYKIKPGIFSFWTLGESRHDNLSSWKELEKKTVKKGGLGFEVGLIARIIKKQIINFL
jgi:lipopolysaccharide/colanic/teichoic acid biosynthesis glycosyltransferase